MAAVLVLAGCANTVAGSARPGAAPAAPVLDPCALLTPEQATFLELQPQGRLTPGKEDRRLPPSCRFSPGEDSDDPSGVDIVASLSMSLATFHAGAAPIEELQLGGLTWRRYPNAFGDGFCNYAVVLSEQSFVEVTTTNFGDKSKACDLAKRAVPFVAAHLPGGAPAPPMPRKPAEPVSPLASMEPCDLITADQMGPLEVQPQGQKTGTGRGNIDGDPGCEWPSLSPDRQPLYVALALDRSADQVAQGEKADEQVQVNGRGWGLHRTPQDSKMNCAAVLAFGEKSAVMVTGGHRREPGKVCDQVLKALPVITAKLPPA
ncbi:DUF3558 family protein [Amycolatopsis suaedae]|uniref:DUF3558 family protein n=1 Tax=Amycolatopsis suaedae TaxID=2510978 RepID=UPI0013EF576A|nr:DUF3558 family protein [Amycolatopsis suaedae]